MGAAGSYWLGGDGVYYFHAGDDAAEDGVAGPGGVEVV